MRKASFYTLKRHLLESKRWRFVIGWLSMPYHVQA